MKKITSFLMMAVLCCAGAFAQATEYVDKLVTIGTAQAEMVPGKWYFLHNPRNPDQSATDFAEVGGTITTAGGFVTDKGLGNHVHLTASSVIDEVTNEEGVSANAYMANFVRFVAVKGEEGAYNIQFGTGNWLADAPGNGTVNNNNYIAGNAGKYNFYLVTIGGVPNAAGRFAWNKYNMANRVDNNGAGGTVVFWAEGETTGEDGGWTTDADIKGNKIWQIYDIIVVGNLDKYEETFNALLADYDAICGQAEGTFIDQLKDGVNVGDKPGNYRPEDVNAFLELHNYVEEVIMPTRESEGLEGLQTLYPTAEDLKKFNDDYVAAWNHMIENKVPRAMTGIQPGYYTFNSCLFWYTTKNDTTFYTAEEAENANAESGLVEGDPGYITAGDVKEVTSTQVAAPIKSLYSSPTTANDERLAWGNQQKRAQFLWKIETVEGKPYEYRMLNMANGKTHISIAQSANSILQLNDTATVCFDWRNNEEQVVFANEEGVQDTATVVSFNIRSSKQAEGGYNYLHCGGHSGGAGTGPALIVGWSDGGATRWYMTPIDEATVENWINGPEAQLRKKIEKGDSIAAAFPAQLEIAKDIETTIYETDSVVVTADQFYSQYTTEDAQTIPDGQTVYDFMLDGKQSTYWHSKWENGAVNAKVHYLQIHATETMDGLYAVKLQRRPVSGDHITELIAVGFEEEPTDETVFADGKELGTLKLPLTSNSETVVTNTFDATGMNYVRFYSNSTAAAASGGGAGRGYWHASAFNVFKASAAPRYETTQYDVRKAEADALAAAVATWNEKGFAADSLELIEDPTFAAAYEALVAAYEAWNKVYVDPTELRNVIASAPDKNLFVYGKNPGQWPETRSAGNTPEEYLEVLADANAYNAAGAYTPAESEAKVNALQGAIDGVFASANKVETGKWYRFSFPTEEMFDNYGWNKDGIKAAVNAHGIETAPALFGKTIAVGKGLTTYATYDNAETGNVDTVAVRSVEATEEWFEGDNLCFFEDAEFEEGEDLFQFIQATDSSYMIQNKATGLFIRAGHPMTLSAVPSYFKANQAIGAGGNLIAYTDVLGKTDGAHVYMHAELASNYLTKWETNTVGSKSMMMIEEVEAVAEAPATEYTAKMWPGKVYTYTYPVDVTVTEGATAYGAELVVAEEDTTVVLKAIEAEVISAGTPFILIADLEGEYITTADRLKQIASEILAKEGKYGLNEKQQANTQLSDEHVLVSMNHGMEVDTVVTELLNLRGTLKSATVEAGKGIVASENGFKHTLVNTNVGAYGAWIASDFDPESADVLSGLVINIEGSIDTGISEVLDKVAKSGNIYNAAGQLVGKGNINTVNSLPAGVYIVNGVKVTKK